MRIRSPVVQRRNTQVWLYPGGGLCNRMRVLDSAIQFYRAQPCRLTVIWLLKDELHCRFEKLFEPIRVLRHFHTFDCKNRRGLFLRKMYRRWLVNPWMDALVTGEQHEKLDLTNVGTEALLKGHSTLLETWMSFYKKGKPFADFRPRGHLQSRIDEQVSYFSRTVGVHIRRTDNAVAIAHSPTALFYEAIDRELERHPETTFFVATDSLDEEEAIKARYPGKILSYPKRSLHRGERTGIEDAIIDLYCLSRTARILGSFNSSFSETAGAIGGIEVTWVH